MKAITADGTDYNILDVTFTSDDDKDSAEKGFCNKILMESAVYCDQQYTALFLLQA